MEVRFSPDTRYVLAGQWDETANLWEVATGELVHTWSHLTQVSAVEFSSNGRWAYTADTRLRVWDVASGTLLREFDSPTSGRIDDLAVGAGDQNLFAHIRKGAGGVATSEVYNVHLANGSSSLVYHAGSAVDHVQSRIETSADGGVLLVMPQGSYENVSVPDHGGVGDGTLILDRKGDRVVEFGDQSLCGAVTDDGRHCLVHRLRGARLRVYDCSTATVLWTVETKQGRVHAVAVSADGRYALTGGGDEESGDYAIRLWELPRRVWSANTSHHSTPRSDTRGR